MQQSSKSIECINLVFDTYFYHSCIAKYASKVEKNVPGFPEMLDGILRNMANDGSAQSACQKLNKMLAKR